MTKLGHITRARDYIRAARYLHTHGSQRYARAYLLLARIELGMAQAVQS